MIERAATLFDIHGAGTESSCILSEAWANPPDRERAPILFVWYRPPGEATFRIVSEGLIFEPLDLRSLLKGTLVRALPRFYRSWTSSERHLIYLAEITDDPR